MKKKVLLAGLLLALFCCAIVVDVNNQASEESLGKSNISLVKVKASDPVACYGNDDCTIDGITFKDHAPIYVPQQ